jgi:hypothetical protein
MSSNRTYRELAVTVEPIALWANSSVILLGLLRLQIHCVMGMGGVRCGEPEGPIEDSY